MHTIDPQSWKQDLPAFREKTAEFYAGTLDKASYKGFSGLYGSYAQKDGKASMLRLRMTAGRMSKEKMAFIADVLVRYPVPRVHLTTCQTVQLHDLDQDTVCDVMEEALDHGIVTMGGGGDFPRNVTCSPLSGVEKGEYFDVLPWAEAAGAYLMNFIKAEKMPRKLKVGFSNSPANVTHATYRDLGFAARPDGCFDVYSAGGLGNNPRFGVKVAEAVAPEKILYYVKAMWLTFRAYGNYENRGKARSRYMQETLGGPEAYAKAFREKLAEVEASGENLDLTVEIPTVSKEGDGVVVDGPRVIAQKQPGLYAVAWHPIGGQVDKQAFCDLSAALAQIPGTELRLSPDQTVYIINLNGEEAQRVLALTADGARNAFELRQLHWRKDLPGGRAGLSGPAARLRGSGAECGRARWRPASDVYFRLHVLLRNPPDRRHRPAGRIQAGGWQAAVCLRPLCSRRKPSGRRDHGPGAGNHSGKPGAGVPGGTGQDRGCQRSELCGLECAESRRPGGNRGAVSGVMPSKLAP